MIAAQPRPEQWPLYYYRATVDHLRDGDTVVVLVSEGLLDYRLAPLRLAGINTAELKSKDPAEKTMAYAAVTYLDDLLTAPDGSYRLCYLHTYRDKISFDRFVTDLFVEGPDGRLVDLAVEMLNSGLAEEEAE